MSILFNLVSVDNTKCNLQIHKLKRFISIKEPGLNKNYLKAMLSWSNCYELRDSDAWDKITFNNETKMKLHSVKCEFVRRLTRKQNNPH